MLQICQNIRQSRRSMKLSQQEVADKLTIILKKKIDRDTYKNWEINTEPSLSMIKTIAEVIGVPAHALLVNIIDYSEVATQRRPDLEFPVKLSAEDFDKLRFSLSVLDSIFLLESNLNKVPRLDVQAGPLDNTKPHPLKEVKKKRKDSV